MNKRELRKLLAPKVTKKIQDLAEAVRNKRTREYIISVFRTEVEGADTLVLDIFDDKSAPFMRAFFQEDDYITLNMQSKKTSWKTGALDSILEYRWMYPVKSHVHMATKKDRKLLYDWVDEYCRNHKVKTHYTFNDPEDIIDKYQEDIKHRRLMIKAQRKRDWLDNRMSFFKELPEGFEPWIDEIAMYNHNYIFYDKKKGYAYCTRCQNDFKLHRDGELQMKKCGWVSYGPQGIKHNKDAVCPFCMSKDIGVKTVAKSIGYSRQQLVEAQWAIVIQPTEIEEKSAVMVRYICCTKDYRESFVDPKLGYYEMYRSIHFEDHCENYEWGWDIHFHKDDWIPERQKGWYWSPSKFQAPVDGVIPYDISDEVLKGSWLQYSCCERFAKAYLELHRDKNSLGPWFFDQWFNFYRDHKSIEKFIKIGWDKMAVEIVDGREEDSPYLRTEIKNLLNEEGRTVAEVIGVSREQFLMIRNASDNPIWRDVEILRYANQQEIPVSEKEYRELRYIHDNGRSKLYQEYIDWKDCTTLHKLKKYTDSLPKNAKPGDYFEYLEWTKELGYDMRNEFNLYPKDFIKKHNERSKEYIKQKNKAQREAAKEFNRLLRKYRQDTKDVEALNMNIDGLFIRLPESLKELSIEGENLHHCVGTYREKVMNGETTIFFIRKISAPNKSYYTLEWKDSRVVQCRGRKNCDMTPQVKAFVEMFKVKMVEYEKSLMKVRRAG